MTDTAIEVGAEMGKTLVLQEALSMRGGPES